MDEPRKARTSSSRSARTRSCCRSSASGSSLYERGRNQRADQGDALPLDDLLGPHDDRRLPAARVRVRGARPPAVDRARGGGSVHRHDPDFHAERLRGNARGRGALSSRPQAEGTPLPRPRSSSSFLAGPPQIRARINSIASLNERTNRDRIAMVHAGLRMIREAPLFGIGPEMVKRYYVLYRERTRRWEVPHLHNNTLQIAAANGLLAAAAYLALMALFFSRAIGLLRKETRPDRAALLAGALLAGSPSSSPASSNTTSGTPRWRWRRCWCSPCRSPTRLSKRSCKSSNASRFQVQGVSSRCQGKCMCQVQGTGIRDRSGPANLIPDT